MPTRTGVVFLLGPTAAGKTSLALDAAERVGADIVSCDSRQLFRGMAIGTAQPDADERARVPHHLVGVAEPTERWSAGDYARAALDVLTSLAQAGRPALVVGGSGLYADALRDGLDDIPKDLAVRARLDERFEREGADALYAELTAADPVAAAKMHPRNRPRVVRALEVLAITGRPLSSFWGGKRDPKVPGPVFVVTRERPELDARIDARVVAMMEEGWKGEVARLLEAGFAPSWPSYRSLGYPDMVEVVEGRLSEPDAVTRIQGATRRFARRQLTWLKGRHADATWLDAGDSDASDRVCRALETASPSAFEMEP